jgi:hypothetical protein
MVFGSCRACSTRCVGSGLGKLPFAGYSVVRLRPSTFVSDYGETATERQARSRVMRNCVRPPEHDGARAGLPPHVRDPLVL